MSGTVFPQGKRCQEPFFPGTVFLPQPLQRLLGGKIPPEVGLHAHQPGDAWAGELPLRLARVELAVLLFAGCINSPHGSVALISIQDVPAGDRRPLRTEVCASLRIIGIPAVTLYPRLARRRGGGRPGSGAPCRAEPRSAFCSGGVPTAVRRSETAATAPPTVRSAFAAGAEPRSAPCIASRWRWKNGPRDSLAVPTLKVHHRETTSVTPPFGWGISSRPCMNFFHSRGK